MYINQSRSNDIPPVPWTLPPHEGVEDSTGRLYETPRYPHSINKSLPAIQILLLALHLSNESKLGTSGRCQDTFDWEMGTLKDHYVKSSPSACFGKERSRQIHCGLPAKQKVTPKDFYEGLSHMDYSPYSLDSYFRHLSVRQISSSANYNPHSSASNSILPRVRSSEIGQIILEAGHADLKTFQFHCQLPRILMSEVYAFWNGLTTVANAFKSIYKSWQLKIANLRASFQVPCSIGSKSPSNDDVSSVDESQSKHDGLEIELLRSSRTRTLISSGDGPPCLDELGDKGPTIPRSNGYEVEKERLLSDLDADSRMLELVESLMKDLWKHFDRDLKSMVAGAETSSSNNTPAATSTTSGQGSTTGHKGQKRGTSATEDDIEGDGDDDSSRCKRSRAGSEQLHLESSFACPYRKRDPRKYSVRDWRSCALTPLHTIARVKAHLYRHHVIYHCERCNEVFKTQDDLNSHRRAMKPCELAESEFAPEGVTQNMVEKLRSRKKAHAGQTEAERWCQIYLILFPDTETSALPSPYFEAIQDIEESTSPESTDLARYEAHLREELPRLVRLELERRMEFEIGPIEERVRAQLIEIIKDAQAKAFDSFRAIQTPATATESTASRSDYDRRLEHMVPIPAAPENALSATTTTQHQESPHSQFFNNAAFSGSGYSSKQTHLTLPPLWPENQPTDVNTTHVQTERLPSLPHPRNRLDKSRTNTDPATQSLLSFQSISLDKDPPAATPTNSETTPTAEKGGMLPAN